MRWTEIDLTHLEGIADDLLQAVRDRQDELPRLQADLGLDSPMITRFFEQQGRLLFQGVLACVPGAFASETGDDHGFHLIVPDEHLDLPWNCLHNGIRFLLEDAPICASPWSLDHESEARPRQWMTRWRETRFADDALGRAGAADVARRFRPEDCSEPEILFVNGRRDGPGRARAWEEQAQLDSVLQSACDGVRLARLDAPAEPPSPAGLMRRARNYQAFHYTDMTHRRPDRPATAPADIGGWDAEGDHPGGELDIVGVDQVTSILDEVSARAERDLAPGWTPRPAAEAVAVAAPAWEFEDGPLRPEDLQRLEAAPPLVFSNSWLSLPALGSRFLRAGTSTFVGTQALVANIDARTFSADVYQAMSSGLGTARAVRDAAMRARDRHGRDHPLWLSYSVVGMGTLALQYL